jgi:hypothetical protein
MESKNFYLSTGIKVNKLVKIKDRILPKTKVQKNLRLIKRLKKQSVLQKTHHNKINQPKIN